MRTVLAALIAAIMLGQASPSRTQSEGSLESG